MDSGDSDFDRFLFLAVSQFEPAENLIVVMVMIVMILLANFLAATQDIASDALAIDSLASQQRAWAGGIKVAAYRVGMIIGGGVILNFADALNRNYLICCRHQQSLFALFQSQNFMWTAVLT